MRGVRLPYSRVEHGFGPALPPNPNPGRADAAREADGLMLSLSRPEDTVRTGMVKHEGQDSAERVSFGDVISPSRARTESLLIRATVPGSGLARSLAGCAERKRKRRPGATYEVSTRVSENSDAAVYSATGSTLSRQ
jgi:hypothetical protein